MSSHSPHPWKMERIDGKPPLWIIRDAENCYLACLEPIDARTADAMETNGTLMAAAPARLAERDALAGEVARLREAIAHVADYLDALGLSAEDSPSLEFERELARTALREG